MQHKLVFIETQDVVETTLALDNYRRACDCGRGAVFFSVARYLPLLECSVRFQHTIFMIFVIGQINFVYIYICSYIFWKYCLFFLCFLSLPPIPQLRRSYVAYWLLIFRQNVCFKIINFSNNGTLVIFFGGHM